MSLDQPDNPKTLYCRFEFDGYGSTRVFLDRLADLSERLGYYPNVDFGTNYVRVGIEAEDQARLAEAGSSFIEEMERLGREG